MNCDWKAALEYNEQLGSKPSAFRKDGIWRARRLQGPLNTANGELILDEKNGSSGRTRTYNPPVNSCGARSCDGQRATATALNSHANRGVCVLSCPTQFATVIDREGAQKWAQYSRGDPITQGQAPACKSRYGRVCICKRPYIPGAFLEWPHFDSIQSRPPSRV